MVHQSVRGSTAKPVAGLFDIIPDSNSLLSALQAAARLNCSPKTVFHWAKIGYLPCIKIGKLVRFKIQDIEEFIARHRGL